ncbi:hypothetical protein MKW94_000012 [Papaver nudicaule]|uniref:Uncharacterized protein n=1 Tax=Papaver nudicaule TaxID=74823 RepID=A0AA41RXZ6_PAPNU|nr:hypothetical protein [Papaver nudicaule]
MVDAERRLLGLACQDPDNQHFVLLSDSCVPLHYVYNYLMDTNISFIDCYEDLGPHGSIEYKDFRKGSQWLTLKRQHVMMFRLYCRPGMDEGRNCYSDEHYLQTFFYMMDPGGIAKWSVTQVDWFERKWHPKTYLAQDDKACMWNGMKRPCYVFARFWFCQRPVSRQVFRTLLRVQDNAFSSLMYCESKNL